jgi:hypothetical protein
MRPATASKENTPGSARARAPQPAAPPLRFINLTRATNVSIMLTQFGGYGEGAARTEAIRAALLRADESLGPERLGLLLQLAPSAEEAKALRPLRGGAAELAPPEAFLAEMAAVPRLAAKVGALLFRHQFAALRGDAAGGLAALARACAQVRASARLRRVLAAQLAAGNALNAGTRHGGAEALQLASLDKLRGVKATTAPEDLAAAAAATTPGGGAKAAARGSSAPSTPSSTPRPPAGGPRGAAADGASQGAGGGEGMEEEEDEPPPAVVTLEDFVAWQVHVEAEREMGREGLAAAAMAGYLTQELGSLADAVRRMQSGALLAARCRAAPAGRPTALRPAHTPPPWRSKCAFWSTRSSLIAHRSPPLCSLLRVAQTCTTR